MPLKLGYCKNIWQNGHKLLLDTNEDEHRKYPSKSQLAGHRKLEAKLSIPEHGHSFCSIKRYGEIT